MKKYYLAYGSNLNIRQMKFRCPTAKIMGTTVIKDHELLFRGSRTGSYLTIEPKEGASLPAAVWEVTADDIESLDRYEGYPSFYYKKEMTVTYTGIASGVKRRRKVFAYIMHEDRPVGIPTERYVDACYWGYREFGFDPEILFDAVDRSRREAGI
ncbi:MAG: gamma-glutamylcyclotransferase [Oscillospiraceae bacterium]|nr:gamma-glutamylcyclotransferase [Oscillospiraceae bacterium]